MDAQLIDRLHPWLLATLTNSDLDPKDMTDYVVSLLTVPGSRDEVRTRCISELGEFLESNTIGFVDAMFAEIDRLQSPAVPGQQQAQAPEQQLHQQQQQQQQQQATGPLQEHPAPPQMAGGQEEFRRNFRGDAPSFQYQPPAGANANDMSGQFVPPPFPPSEGFPFPPGFPPPGFPTQGFGRPPQGQGGYQRQNRQRNFGSQQRSQHNQQFNPIRSIRNELSVANKRLVVEGIPEEKLSEDAIREYFGRFGSVTSVTLHSPERMAEVEFEAHDQAVAAHKCPDPIFDNRFVKVFWRKKMPQEEEPEPDIEAVRRMQAIKQQQFQEKETKRKELTTRLKEVMNTQGQMLGEKQRLLSSATVTPEAIQEHQQRYDQLSQETQRLKGELALLSGSGGQPGARGGHRGGFRGGRGGSPYGQSFRGSYRGRGAFRGGYSRGGGFVGASLDRRPKGVYLEGVSQDQDEILRGRLAASSYSDYQRDGDSGVVVDFPDRKSAEEFFNTVQEIPELGPNIQKRYVHTESSSSADSKGGEGSNAMDES